MENNAFRKDEHLTRNLGRAMSITGLTGTDWDHVGVRRPIRIGKKLNVLSGPCIALENKDACNAVKGAQSALSRATLSRCRREFLNHAMELHPEPPFPLQYLHCYYVSYRHLWCFWVLVDHVFYKRSFYKSSHVTTLISPFGMIVG